MLLNGNNFEKLNFGYCCFIDDSENITWGNENIDTRVYHIPEQSGIQSQY